VEQGLHGKKVVVLGMGVSGQALAAWLLSMGARPVCSDLRPADHWPPGVIEWCANRGVAVETGEHGAETCRTADLVAVSPGVPLHIPALRAARAAGVPITGELALAVSFWKGPVLGITGTNGKTTTTRLVGEILRTAGLACIVAGNIGTPLSGLLARNGRPTLAVLEVSSFQMDSFPAGDGPGAGRVRFRAAAWLNLAPDHLDRYQDFRAYGDSKARIMDFQGPEDWTVLNAADTRLDPWRKRGLGRRLDFGWGKGDRPGAWCDPRLRMVTVLWPDGGAEEYDLAGWTLTGRHNIENLAAGILLSRIAGAEPEAVQAAIPAFRAPAHRLQFITRAKGIQYYDDSKATNVASALTALASMEQPVVLIAGGRGKGEDYSPLGEAARTGRLRAAVLIGEEAGAIGRALGPFCVVAAMNLNGDGWGTMRKAVAAATALAEPGEAVLLAPACASFDMFQNYEDRGRAFQEAVFREVAS